MAACAEALRLALRAHCDRPGAAAGADLSDVFVDFEMAQPTESEAEVYELTAKVLEQAETVLGDVAVYGDGATGAIRQAIKHPSDAQCQAATWNEIVACVCRLRIYHDLAMRIAQVLPLILWELCSGPVPPAESLESHQALAKHFAQMLDFCLRFDEIKMCTPAMQNDFSYYRRAMLRDGKYSRMGAEPNGNEPAAGAATTTSDSGLEHVPMDMANTISFFYAEPTPMLTTARKATQSFVRTHADLPVENTTDTLATMANVCRVMVEQPSLCARFRNTDTRLFCLRVMTAAIIVYDHVHPDGAFVRNSSIDMRRAIGELAKLQTQTENLMNALRYNCPHADDSTTPKHIRALLYRQ